MTVICGFKCVVFEPRSILKIAHNTICGKSYLNMVQMENKSKPFEMNIIVYRNNNSMLTI